MTKKEWEVIAEIKTDVAWLKKAFWVLATGGVTFNVTLAGGIIMYLLRAS